MSIAIIGCGAAGTALAAELHRRGLGPLRLHDSDPTIAAAITAQGGVSSSGHLDVRLAPAPHLPLTEAVEGAFLVVVAATADRHEEIACALAPLLTERQVVLLYCGYVAGGFVFARALRAAGCRSAPTVVEAMNTLHLCALEAPGRVFVAATKRWLEVTGQPAGSERRLLERVGLAFPELAAGRDPLETGLNNPNPIGHLPAAVFNHGLFAAPDGPAACGTLQFDELLTPAVGRAVEAFDAERVRLVAALGLAPITRAAFNARSYPAGSRHMGAVPRIGRKLLARHVEEDVPCALVPMLGLAGRSGLQLPVAQLLYDALALLTGTVARGADRTAARLPPAT
jgi:hypothetical protein